MERITKRLPELAPKKIGKNIKRFWNIYVNPPKERNVFLSPEELPVTFRKVDQISTAGEPKQVVYDSKLRKAYVSCMKGNSLQIFDIRKSKIIADKEIAFQDQCVEVLLDNNFLYVTTTNFDRPPHELRNRLWILKPQSGEIISSVDTGGNWSKLISASPDHNELLVSNWHSHNISVIDIKDPKRPSLKQILEWGEAPRGIAFTPDGKRAIVTGFYSGNLGILTKESTGTWSVSYTSPKFDAPNYSGNMRHILVTSDGERAVISNLGRNLIHVWDITKREFVKSIRVGKSPNSICWFKNENQVAVSCRDSSCVYLVDLKLGKAVGRSVKTGKEPTGLCEVEDGFLVTSFGRNTLQLHKLANNL